MKPHVNINEVAFVYPGESCYPAGHGEWEQCICMNPARILHSAMTRVAMAQWKPNRSGIHPILAVHPRRKTPRNPGTIVYRTHGRSVASRAQTEQLVAPHPQNARGPGSHGARSAEAVEIDVVNPSERGWSACTGASGISRPRGLTCSSWSFVSGPPASPLSYLS
jgi:hypothetical protein